MGQEVREKRRQFHCTATGVFPLRPRIFHAGNSNFYPKFHNTVHIGYKAGGGTRKNCPYNQYGLISDIPMEGPVKRVEWFITNIWP